MNLLHYRQPFIFFPESPTYLYTSSMSWSFHHFHLIIPVKFNSAITYLSKTFIVIKFLFNVNMYSTWGQSKIKTILPFLHSWTTVQWKSSCIFNLTSLLKFSNLSILTLIKSLMFIYKQKLILRAAENIGAWMWFAGFRVRVKLVKKIHGNVQSWRMADHGHDYFIATTRSLSERICNSKLG